MRDGEAWAGAGPANVAEYLELAPPLRIIAHRGCSGSAPENTLAAFRRALELPIDMIELDVLLSQDRRLVVLHDADLAKTTSGTGRVEEHSLAELRELDAGSSFAPEFAGEPIPTLEEVLDLVRGRMLLNIEIKREALDSGSSSARDGVVAQVLAAVRERDMTGQVLLSSFAPQALLAARELEPEVATAVLFDADRARDRGPVELMDELGARAFHCSARQVTREWVRQCHAAGRPLAVYTVNRRQRRDELDDWGVDAIFTDHPEAMLSA